MAQITGLPQWSKLQVPGGTGRRPRTTGDDFGAGNWRQVEELGKQVTRAAVTTMQHYITNDHRRQQDEAKEDLLYYDTQQQARVDELKQKKHSEAFNTPEEYLLQSEERKRELDEQRAELNRGGGLNDRGGDIYRQALVEGRLAIDQRNLQELNKHVISERTSLTIDMANATNARSIETIKREPWRLTEQLRNVIYPNISDLVEAQGYGAEMVGTGESAIYMADHLKQEATVAATKQAVAALAEQYGAEEALKFFRSGDVASLKETIGQNTWDKIFGAQETKLHAAREKEITNALTVQLDQEVAYRYQNGDDPLTIRNDVIQKYGQTLGVTTVTSILKNVNSAYAAEGPERDKRLTKEYLGALLSGEMTYETLQGSANGDVDKLRAIESAYKEFSGIDATQTTFKTDDILNSDNSVIAQDIKGGNFKAASLNAFKLYQSGKLTQDEYATVAKSINDTRALYDPEKVRDNEVETLLVRADRAKRLQDMEVNATKQATLTRVLESGQGKDSTAYKEADFNTRQFLDKELDARYQGQLESNENIRQRNFYRYDAMPVDEVLKLMSSEAGMAMIARELGGENSTQFKALYAKVKDPARGMSYLTSANVEARNGVRARAFHQGKPFDAKEFAEITPVIDDAITQAFNSYQRDKKITDPDLIPPNIRQALIGSVVDRTMLERAGVSASREASGTTIDNSIMGVTKPEYYARSIKVSVPVGNRSYSALEVPFYGMEVPSLAPSRPMTEEVPSVWTFKRDAATGVEIYMQENIPYVVGVTGHAGVQRISKHAQQFDNPGRLTFFPEYNQFVLYNRTGSKLQAYTLAGEPF